MSTHSQPPRSSPSPIPTQTRRHDRSGRRAREASKIQRSYRANRKKCVRNILEEESPRCEIASDDLIAHFSTAAPSLLQLPEPDFLPNRPVLPITPDTLSYAVSSEEVEIQLRRLPAQSAAGPDGLTYEVWKRNRGARSSSQWPFPSALLTTRSHTSGRRVRPF